MFASLQQPIEQTFEHAKITCLLDGKVDQIATNGLIPNEKEWQGRPFVGMFEASSVENALIALGEVSENRSVYMKEMHLATSHNRMRTIYMCGYREGDFGIFILSESAQELFHLYGEHQGIAETHVGFLHHLAKEADAVMPFTDHAIMSDFTAINNELSNAKRELAKKNHDLDILNKEKDKLMGIVAHDLRSPLTVIITYAYLMEDRMDGFDESMQKAIKAITKNGESMTQLIEDLMDFSKITVGKLCLEKDKTLLPDLLRHAVKLNLEVAEQKNMTIELNCQEALPVVDVDQHKIRQVLNNLIGNAVKFSHNDSPILINASKLKDKVEISVQDKGQGIKSEEQENLFAAFTTTSTKSTAGEKSSGLGLNICKRIVDAHGGQIGVDSQYGEGSKFWFRLPVQD